MKYRATKLEDEGVVDAIRWDGTYSDARDFLGRWPLVNSFQIEGIGADPVLFISTRSGFTDTFVTCTTGDYIVKAGDADVIVLSDEQFRQRFEPVEGEVA